MVLRASGGMIYTDVYSKLDYIICAQGRLVGGGFSRIGPANCFDMLNPLPFQVPEEVGE